MKSTIDAWDDLWLTEKKIWVPDQYPGPGVGVQNRPFLGDSSGYSHFSYLYVLYRLDVY